MAASTSNAADPISCNSYRHDVFINHRGPDAKKTFASHLYRRLISHGLTAFLDQDELQVGLNFESQIKEAIRTASVHIAIFSPRYAESQWCLDELVLMLETGAPIIPVFHHVEPADLRRTQGDGVYAQALRNHGTKRPHESQPRHSSSTIEKWRNALSAVAGRSGLDLEAFNRDEGVLVDKVVELVLKKVKTQLNVAKYPTGLDEKVTDFKRRVLSQQHNGRVGITGLGGVGKTTLALELFNRESPHYSKSHFLSDVRENAKISLPSLQSKLLKGLFQLNNLHIDNPHHGTELLRKHLSSCDADVFLVLDDVDDVDQMDALLPVDVKSPGRSLILITSRHKDVLARSRVQESSIYHLTGLNIERSRELFCSHAFCQAYPISGFKDLVDEFVRACDGLPLSLKVVGSHLSENRDKSRWKEELKSLQQILPEKIQQKLQISYDALQRDEKQMFLDIACFFIGNYMDTVIRIWDAPGCKGRGRRGFQILLDKCLVEVEVHSGNKIIKMHDHLRDLGRDLAKVSKLPHLIWPWTAENIDDSSGGTDHARGIKMLHSEYGDDDDDEELPSFSSSEMKKLELLEIDSDLVECIRKVRLPNLKWFCWRDCAYSSLPPWIPTKKLLVLEVRRDFFGQMSWKALWEEAPLQLRELRVEIPISKIPKSIGQLKHLEWMELNVESILLENDDLPEELCDLPSLKHLQLCITCRSLPESFGNLTNLEYIDLSYCCCLERLPISFGNLIKLKYLDLRECNALTLSSGSFGNISTLEYIDLYYCNNIETLPSQIAHQPSLEELNLSLSNLKEWPGSIGEPSGLEKLELETPLLEALPSSLGRDLRNLKYLKLRGCQELKHLPESILLMNQLIEWTVEDCSLRELNFKAVEGEIETLTDSGGQRTLKNLGRCLLRLQHLKLHNTQISELSFPTGVCPNLQHLDIMDCKNLVEIGPLPNTLIKLQLIGCPQLRKIEGLCGHAIAKLQRPCKEAEELPSIEGKSETESRGQRAFNKLDSSFDKCPLYLQHLELHNTQISEVLNPIDVCPNLQYLVIRDCKDLVEVEPLPNALIKLQLIGCPQVRKLERLCVFSKLQTLDISLCKEAEELPSVEGKSENLVEVGTLTNAVIELELYNCSKLKKPEEPCSRAKLQKLYISWCKEVEELTVIETLVSFERVEVLQKCWKLKSILGSAQLTELGELDVSGCSELEDLPGTLGTLQEVCCSHAKLQEVYISWCKEVEELTIIETLVSLEKLQVLQCWKLKSIRGLAQLTELRELDVSGCSELEDLPGVDHFRSLGILRAYCCKKLKSIRGLAELAQLRELDVSECSELEELLGVEHLLSLERLRADKCVKLTGILDLTQLIQLQELHVSFCYGLEELRGVGHLKSLKVFRVSGCAMLKSIRGLEQLTQLRELDVSYCYDLEELPSIEHLRSLDGLLACNCVKLKIIEGLAQLTQLRELDVSNCFELEELPGVEHLKSLKKLQARSCRKLKSIRG